MATEETHQNPAEDLPLVLIHRIPAFKIPFKERLHRPNQFRFLDPLESSEPTESLLSRLAHCIRVVIVVGPSPINADFLNLLPRLELIVGTSAGVDKIDLGECRRRGITVTNASPAFSEDAADYAVGLLIDVLRRISAGDRFIRTGTWPVKKEYPLGFKLGRRRVGIVGFGNIGTEVANRLVPFGCTIAYNSRNQKASVSFPYYASVLELAANSDVLILCCALTGETHHVVNAAVLEALGKDGVIINVGRGGLIDEKELVHFLVRGELGGAGLDVFENEPTVPEELFALDNVVLSPHRAVLTPESFEGLLDLVAANLKAFFSNEPLLSVFTGDQYK